MKAYQLKMGKLRMDSSQMTSNICDASRLRLLVEVLLRTHCMLNEVEQERYTEAFDPLSEREDRAV